MLQKRQTKSTEVYLTVVVLLVLHLTQTEASPLRKRARWNGNKEETNVMNGFKPGVIVFGEDTKNASVEDDTFYQADYSGLVSRGTKDQFNAMFPELWCGNDHMKFTASGRSVSHFGMRPYPHLPLSYAPTSCGYSVEGNPLRLVFQAPYDACDIVIKDGCYNLPLLWRGAPVILKCSKPDDSSSVPPMIPPHFPWFPWPPQEPTVPPTQYPLFPWFPWPVPQETTPAPPQDPVFFKFPPGLHHHHPYPWIFPTPAPPFPQDPVPPQFPGVYLPPDWHQLPKAQSTIPSPQDPLPKNWWYQHIFKNYPHQSQTTSPPPPQDPLNWWDWYKMQVYPQPTQTTSPQDPNPQLLQNYWHLQGHKSPVAPQHPWGHNSAKVPPIMPVQSVQLPFYGKYFTQSPTTPPYYTQTYKPPSTTQPPVSKA